MVRRDDTLPHELILSIQRVLDLQVGRDSDPLDNLSDDFDPVGIINGFFPDGKNGICYISYGDELTFFQRHPLASWMPCKHVWRKANAVFSMR